MKIFLAFTLVFPIFLLQAEKRDWYYGTGLDGQAKEFFGTKDMHSRFISSNARKTTYWESRLGKLSLSIKAIENSIEPSVAGPQKNKLIYDRYKLMNNRARCLIHLQKIDAALEILLELEKKWPGESIVAENLAVCFDLKGDFDKARQWISLAIARNSMAAYSNLWVYKKIITARKNYHQDKDYLQDNSVSGLTVSQNPQLEPLDLSSLDNFQKRWSLAGTAKHIRQQLKTQMQLRRESTAPVLAHLMEELACIYAINEVCEVALPIFELAQKYGHPEKQLIAARIDLMKKLIEANPHSMVRSRSIFAKLNKGGLWVLSSIVGIFIILLTYFYFVKKAPLSEK